MVFEDIFYFISRVTQLLHLLQIENAEEIIDKLIEITDNSDSWTFDGKEYLNIYQNNFCIFFLRINTCIGLYR